MTFLRPSLFLADPVKIQRATHTGCFYATYSSMISIIIRKSLQFMKTEMKKEK